MSNDDVPKQIIGFRNAINDLIKKRLPDKCLGRVLYLRFTTDGKQLKPAYSKGD
jgi:hypothetical protein